MSIIYGYLSVKEDESLLKAIANEVTGLGDVEITEGFLEEVSTDYPTRSIAEDNEEETD